MEITFENLASGKTHTMIQKEKSDGVIELSIGEVIEEKFKTPEDICDGVDLNQDLLFLMGYMWAEGNQKRVFPSEHVCDIHNYLIKKYGNVKAAQ